MAGGAPTALRPEFCQPRRDSRAHFFVADHLTDTGAVRQARMRAAGGDIRKYQETHLVAAMARHDDVLRQRRQRSDTGDPQRADADPGAGIELEILGDATVEK